MRWPAATHHTFSIRRPSTRTHMMRKFKIFSCQVWIPPLPQKICPGGNERLGSFKSCFFEPHTKERYGHLIPYPRRPIYVTACRPPNKFESNQGQQKRSDRPHFVPGTYNKINWNELLLSLSGRHHSLRRHCFVRGYQSSVGE